MAMTNNNGKIIHPIAIPSWRSIHRVMNIDAENLSEKPKKYRLRIAVSDLLVVYGTSPTATTTIDMVMTRSPNLAT